MHTWPSEDDLSPQERQILSAMWKAKAIGDRVISLRDLRARLPDEVKANYVSHLKTLKEKLFIQISHGNNQDAASLTPLGLAFIRQIQDDDLMLMTGERGSTK
jgi:DNA-binding MarR family transcriptional regulator